MPPLPSHVSLSVTCSTLEYGNLTPPFQCQTIQNHAQGVGPPEKRADRRDESYREDPNQETAKRYRVHGKGSHCPAKQDRSVRQADHGYYQALSVCPQSNVCVPSCYPFAACPPIDAAPDIPQHILLSRCGKRLSVFIPSCSSVYSPLRQCLMRKRVTVYSRNPHYSLETSCSLPRVFSDAEAIGMSRLCPRPVEMSPSRLSTRSGSRRGTRPSSKRVSTSTSKCHPIACRMPRLTNRPFLRPEWPFPHELLLPYQSRVADLPKTIISCSLTWMKICRVAGPKLNNLTTRGDPVNARYA